MSESYKYYVSIEKRFSVSESDAGLHNDYILGNWEDRMPQDLIGYWTGHGTAFGYRKLTLKNLFKGRKYRCYIKSYDVSFSIETAEEGAMLVEQLQHLTKEAGVILTLGVHFTSPEEE